MKNNVTRFLEARNVPFTAHELPEEKLGAEEAAAALGVAPELVYKTIVVLRQGRGKPVLALAPGNLEVDLKALAKALGEKKVALSTQRQAEQLTGLQAGGISPLALLNRGFEIVIDQSVQAHPEIVVSGGQRGLNIQLTAQALIDLTGAKVAKIAR